MDKTSKKEWVSPELNFDLIDSTNALRIGTTTDGPTIHTVS
jgi:hypothetical protein